MNHIYNPKVIIYLISIIYSISVAYTIPYLTRILNFVCILEKDKEIKNNTSKITTKNIGILKECELRIQRQKIAMEHEVQMNKLQVMLINNNLYYTVG